MARELGKQVDVVLAFDIADDALIARLSGRTTCETCQKPFTGLTPGAACPNQDGGVLVRRKDDEPDAIRNRLRVYREQTAPVLSWYTKAGAQVAHIDAVGSFDDVTARALKAVGR